MSRQQLPHLVLSLLLLVSPPTTTTTTLAAAAEDRPPSKPILARLAKDPATSLYTISIKDDGAPLVLDLAGPLVWSTCPAAHPTIPCSSPVCRVAVASTNHHHPAGCGAAVTGERDTSSTTGGWHHCACTAYPSNQVTGRCGHDDATAFTLSANATDGKNPLFPVSFSAFGSCAPGELLASLPAGAAGVAGLSRLPLALPAQVASTLKVAKQVTICLPGGYRGTGVAIFGGGPIQLQASPEPVELSRYLRQDPLPFLKSPVNGAYYIGVTGIAVNGERVALPPGALDLHAGGGVMLSTVVPYTTLRSDIYRPLLGAFDAATSGVPRAPPVAPFERCYQASGFWSDRYGFHVASIDLLFGGGRSWTLRGAQSLVQLNEQTACFAFLEMGSATVAPGSPAVIFGGYQLEEHLLMLDLVNETIGICGPMALWKTNCGLFDFTMSGS